MEAEIDQNERNAPVSEPKTSYQDSAIPSPQPALQLDLHQNEEETTENSKGAVTTSAVHGHNRNSDVQKTSHNTVVNSAVTSNAAEVDNVPESNTELENTKLEMSNPDATESQMAQNKDDEPSETPKLPSIKVTTVADSHDSDTDLGPKKYQEEEQHKKSVQEEAESHPNKLESDSSAGIQPETDCVVTEDQIVSEPKDPLLEAQSTSNIEAVSEAAPDPHAATSAPEMPEAAEIKQDKAKSPVVEVTKASVSIMVATTESKPEEDTKPETVATAETTPETKSTETSVETAAAAAAAAAAVVLVAAAAAADSGGEY